MYKAYFAVFCLICYSIFYIVSVFVVSQQNTEENKVPSVGKAIVLSKVDESSKSKTEVPLPSAPARKIVELYGENPDWKMKKTPLSFDDDYKTLSPRLSKEEIAKAPVVKIIPMKVNGEYAEMIIVEKDGLRYDASDGVMVHMPRDFSNLFKKNK